MSKTAFCMCKNKGANQLRGNQEADQRLCFHYIDSTIPYLSNSKISSQYPSSVDVQPILWRPRSETQKKGFHTKWLILRQKAVTILLNFEHTKKIHMEINELSIFQRGPFLFATLVATLTYFFPLIEIKIFLSNS